MSFLQGTWMSFNYVSMATFSFVFSKKLIAVLASEEAQKFTLTLKDIQTCRYIQCSLPWGRTELQVVTLYKYNS